MFKGITFRKEDIHYYVMLLSAPVLLTIYRYHGYPHCFFGYFPRMRAVPGGDVIAAYWQFSIFFLLMFVLPVVYVKFVMRKPLGNFGWGLGDVKYGVKWLLTIPLLVVPLMFVASKMPGLRVEYPLAKTLLHNRDALFFVRKCIRFVLLCCLGIFFQGFSPFRFAGAFRRC
jgi:hypothetical protein